MVFCMRLVLLIELFLFSFAVPAGASTLCQKWEPAVRVGQLPLQPIDEASGLVRSRAHSRLYVVNDSGDGPHLYSMDLDGSNLRTTIINGFRPVDVEDLGLGPCPVGKNLICLAVADVGDNFKRRKEIEIVFVGETFPMPLRVDPVARLKLRYPDGAHDAEAVAVLPNGDLAIVTKETVGVMQEAKPAQVFRLRSAKIRALPTDVQVLEKIGEIDIPGIVMDTSYGGRVTGMSVSSDGSRFLLMTYDKALEFHIDLSGERIPSPLKSGQDYTIIELKRLIQQETIAYDLADKAFYYTTEVEKKLFKSQLPAPIMKMQCLQ